MSQQPQDPAQSQVAFLLADFNTRLRDLEERNRLIRERVQLLGQNLISSRDELDSELEILKKDNSSIKKDLGNLKSIISNLLSETDKFVKRDEIALVERMLKDFQPLEFARIKDVEEIINQKISKIAPSQSIKIKENNKIQQKENLQ